MMEQCENRKVLLVPEGIFEDESNRHSLEVITLKHPFSALGCKFMLAESGSEVYEISTQKDKLASWFIEDTVKEEGSVHIFSKFDPLYLILPYLRKACDSEKFVLLDQILSDDEYPDCAKLIKSFSNEDILNIADKSGSDQFVGFKYNQEKTLDWLTSKIHGINIALKKSGLFISASDEDDKENEDIHLEYAFGILSNYIPSDISSLLQSRLNIRKKSDKRHANDSSNHPQAKKTKTDKTLMEKSKKQPKMSRTQRQLSKVDKRGMRSISSFFSAKTK